MKDENGGPLFVHVSYPKGSWVTVLIEWSNIGDRVGSININNGQSITNFTCEELDPTKVHNDVLIGGKLSGHTITQAMHGDLAALEIYASAEHSKLPDYLKKLIIQDQMVVVESNDDSDCNNEPPVKRKKISQ